MRSAKRTAPTVGDTRASPRCRKFHASTAVGAKKKAGKDDAPTSAAAADDADPHDRVGTPIPLSFLKDAADPTYQPKAEYPVWLFLDTAADYVPYSTIHHASDPATQFPDDGPDLAVPDVLQFWNKFQPEPPTYFLGNAARRTLGQLRKVDYMDMTHEDMRRHSKLERRIVIKGNNLEIKLGK